MAVKVGLYERGYAAIRDRLDALDLPLEIRTFDAEGRFLVDGARRAPEDVDLDYLWFSPEISADKVTAMAFELPTRVRSVSVVQTFNAGLDHPAYKAMADRGITICNSSAQGVAISEFVFAHVFALFHPFGARADLQASKTWQRTPFREIAGTTWLVVGFGPIGRGIARRAKAFDARVSVVRRTPETTETVDRAGTLADLPALAADADVIVLACPLNSQTANMIDGDVVSAVKPGAILINIGRGGLVDDAALMAGLDAGQFSAAVLDVFREEPLPPEHAFWTHPKIIVTSHTSFDGSGTFGRWQQLFLDNIARYARGEPLANVFDPADLV